MEEEFDEILAKKIKDTLSDYSMEYDDGAWENFKANKKNGKKRKIVWLFLGTASLLLLFVSIGFVFDEKKQFAHPSDIKSTKEQAVDLYEFNQEIDSKSENRIKDKERNIVGTSNSTQTQIHAWKDHNVNASTGTENTKNRRAQTYTHKAKIAKKAGLVLFADGFHVGQPKIEGFHTNLFSPDKNLTYLPLEEVESEEDKTKNQVQIGLQFVPAFGSNNGRETSFKSSNLGGGISVDIPIKSSSFSINTGAVFNSINLSNEQNSITDIGFSTEVGTTLNKENISLLSIDIPFNLRYNFNKKSNGFFIQAGWSSYLTFQEDIELLERTTIALNEFDILGNETGNVEIAEVFSSEETSRNTQTQLVPLGTINFSLGYRSRLSEHLVYELQPFYKYPLASLSTEDIRIPTGGIALKIVFSR